MKQILVQLVVAIAAIGAGYFFDSEMITASLYGGAAGIILAILIQGIDWLTEHAKWLGIYIDAYRPFAHKEIRISTAYLFKIEQNGKYLLVRSARLKDRFQPVGGVYKYLDPTGKRELEALTIITDSSFTNDEVNEHDLRLKMHNKKFLPRYLKWFFSRKNRETDPWREFYEELVKPGFLTQKNFGHIQYDLRGQHFTRLSYSEHFKIYEFLYADIYCLNPANTCQSRELNELSKRKQDDLVWATEDEIKQGRTKEGKLIAPHSNKIFFTQKLEK